MSSPLSAARGPLVYALALALPLVAGGQSFSPQGSEYAISGPLLGDQMFPQISVNSTGGILVWQDNVVDGAGLGIVAQRLNANFSPSYGSFRVNQQTAGDQAKPQVAVLDNGGAAIVWQGGNPGYENIYLRLLTAGGTFTTPNDIQVNTWTNGQQRNPVITSLPGGNLVVAWSSFNQDGSMQGIFARMLNSNGQFLNAAFPVNQFTDNNQRNPAIAALTNGNFVIAWVSENQTVSGIDLLLGANRADIFARIFNRAGAPNEDEFLVNTSSNLCASPSVAGAADGGFTAVWSEREKYMVNTNGDLLSTNSWDVFARSFAADGSPANAAFRVNTHTFGDQFGPKVSTLGANQLVVWTSLGQDGSWEGVYGQLLVNGNPGGTEFRVNTTTVSRQIHPAVASDGANRFLAVWSSYVGATGFDVLAQRYAAGQPLPAPAAPWVSALSQSRLMVTWTPLSGFVSQYEVYMDGATPPNATTVTVSNWWTATGLVPSSTHSFRLAYVLAGGQRSPLSPAAAGKTWGEDLNGDGLPDDWEILYFGIKQTDWQPGWADSDGDGVSNFDEFLAGTDPTDPNSVLRIGITSNQQGRWLNWSTQPGFIYQVQSSADARVWVDFGAPRLAAGTTDSVTINGPQGSGFYRLMLLR